MPYELAKADAWRYSLQVSRSRPEARGTAAVDKMALIVGATLLVVGIVGAALFVFAVPALMGAMA